uniref:Protein kinase domain-containing protein n=1 Tax=Tetradesmus obliquus TaxID=3088 RepID=A0A383V7A5_TETOB|eukprot:jgi/Sobl393_1/3970/SZX60464.1
MIWLHTQEPPILHMDLKTANVLLDRFGTAKVGDVGLSKLKSGIADTASYIQSSVLRGTPAYMAPEYLQRGQCGPFTDVYALGVMMCELLTGKSARDAAAALEDVFEDTSTNNAEQASAALQPLLDPAARWPTATAVEFAGMAAACLQAARRRPNLQSGLQPMFEKMLAAATATATVSVEAPVQHTSHTTCPSTRQPLSVQQLVPSYALAGLLEKMARLQRQEQQQAAAAAATAAAAAAAAQQLQHEQQQQQQQQQQEALPTPPAGNAAQSRATAGLAPPPAAAMPLAPAQPDPRWSELLQAAKASANDGRAWQAFGRCFQGCTEIDLSNQGFGDAHWPALAQHAAQYWRSVQSLDLSYNAIGAAGITALAQAAHHWPQLQDLYLNMNSIGAAGVTALAQAAQHWPNLHSLKLNCNSIGGACVTALVQAAPHWPNLQSLDLSANTIGDAGATALVQAALHWPNLQTLGLGGCNIGDAGVTAMVQAAQHWTNLQILHGTTTALVMQASSP